MVSPEMSKWLEENVGEVNGNVVTVRDEPENYARAPFDGWTLRLNCSWRRQMAAQGFRSLIAAVRGGPRLVPRPDDPWAITCSGCREQVPQARRVAGDGGFGYFCDECVSAASEAF